MAPEVDPRSVEDAIRIDTYVERPETEQIASGVDIARAPAFLAEDFCQIRASSHHDHLTPDTPWVTLGSDYYYFKDVGWNMVGCGTNEGCWISLDSRWLAFKAPIVNPPRQDDLQWSDLTGSAKVSCGTAMVSLWTLFNDLFEGPPLKALLG